MNAPLFRWGEKPDIAGGDDSAGTLGADSQPSPSGGGISDIQMRSSAEAAKTAADSSPRKRGRPRGDGIAGAGRERALQDQVNTAIASQLDALHDPEAWGALLGLPGDAIFAVTGRERWEIRKEERRTLGVTGSAFARTLMITNPRALAAMMLAAALLSCYGTRALAEAKEFRDKKNAAPKGEKDAAAKT